MPKTTEWISRLKKESSLLAQHRYESADSQGWNEMNQILSGSQVMIRNGKIQENYLADIGEPTTAAYRTAVCFMKDGKWQQVVEDSGITLHRFSQYLLQQGCVEAIAMDGGASTEMVLRDHENPSHSFNYPPQGRKISDAIVIKLGKEDKSSSSSNKKLARTYIQQGKLDLFDKLISEDPGLLQMRDSQGNMLLHSALEEKNAEIADLLIKKMPKKDLGKRNFFGDTPLEVAIALGMKSQALNILKSMEIHDFFDINNPERSVLRKLMKTREYEWLDGVCEVLKDLLSRVSRQKLLDILEKVSLLKDVAKLPSSKFKGEISSLIRQKIFDFGMDQLDLYARSHLHYLAQLKDLDGFQENPALASAKAEHFLIKDIHGNSPLHAAVLAGNWKFLKEMKKRNLLTDTTLSLRNNGGKTPVEALTRIGSNFYGEERKEFEEALSLLLDRTPVSKWFEPNAKTSETLIDGLVELHFTQPIATYFPHIKNYVKAAGNQLFHDFAKLLISIGDEKLMKALANHLSVSEWTDRAGQDDTLLEYFFQFPGASPEVVSTILEKIKREHGKIPAIDNLIERCSRSGFGNSAACDFLIISEMPAKDRLARLMSIISADKMPSVAESMFLEKLLPHIDKYDLLGRPSDQMTPLKEISGKILQAIHTLGNKFFLDEMKMASLGQFMPVDRQDLRDHNIKVQVLVKHFIDGLKKTIPGNLEAWAKENSHPKISEILRFHSDPLRYLRKQSNSTVRKAAAVPGIAGVGLAISAYRNSRLEKDRAVYLRIQNLMKGLLETYDWGNSLGTLEFILKSYYEAVKAKNSLLSEINKFLETSMPHTFMLTKSNADSEPIGKAIKNYEAFFLGFKILHDAHLRKISGLEPARETQESEKAWNTVYEIYRNELPGMPPITFRTFIERVLSQHGFYQIIEKAKAQNEVDYNYYNYILDLANGVKQHQSEAPTENHAEILARIRELREELKKTKNPYLPKLDQELANLGIKHP